MNDRPPKFQFDIEETRFEEFLKRAEERLKANSDRVDYESTGKILFADLQPSAYLTHPMERPDPVHRDQTLHTTGWETHHIGTPLLFFRHQQRPALRPGNPQQSLQAIKELESLGCKSYGDGVNHSKCVLSEKEGVIFTANIDGAHGLKTGFEISNIHSKTWPLGV